LDQFRAVHADDMRGRVRTVGIDRDLPSLPRAGGDLHSLQDDRKQAGRHLLAGGDHGVVFARIVQQRCLAAPADQLIGGARHRRDNDRNVVSRIDLTLDVAGDVADAFDIGDRRAAEFHDEPGHVARVSLANAGGKPLPREGAYRYRRRLWPATPTGAKNTRMVKSPAGRRTTVDDGEVARFAALADDWWNPRGKMAPLHKFNPVRLGFIRDQACAQFGRDAKTLDCLKELTFLDVGCGGGIVSEPLARLGGKVTGIDPAEENVEAAKLHAEKNGL